MRFRKKPIVIEAHAYAGEGQEIDGLCPRCREVPDYPHVHTLEGPLRVREGDWIIKGVKGEFYPCKPDIFAATYEPAEEGKP